ncbi:MAG: hypothetical protein U0W24_26460 [Bacteroidales bacterium]
MEKTIQRRKRSFFYIIVSVIFLLIVLAGFTPTYYFPVIQNSFTTDIPIIHIHAALYSFWILFTIVQPALVVTGRTKFHKKIGIAGFILAAGMIIFGLAVAITRVKLSLGTEKEHFHKSFLIIQVTDMILFATFIGSSLLKIKKPEIHKRLMILATLSLLPAALGRICIYTGLPVVITIIYTVPFIVAFCIYDWFKKKKIYKVYILGGLFILTVHIIRELLMETNIWLKISEFIVE